MKRKTLLGIIILTAVCSAFSFTGCGNAEESTSTREESNHDDDDDDNNNNGQNNDVTPVSEVLGIDVDNIDTVSITYLVGGDVIELNEDQIEEFCNSIDSLVEFDISQYDLAIALEYEVAINGEKTLVCDGWRYVQDASYKHSFEGEEFNGLIAKYAEEHLLSDNNFIDEFGSRITEFMLPDSDQIIEMTDDISDELSDFYFEYYDCDTPFEEFGTCNGIIFLEDDFHSLMLFEGYEKIIYYRDCSDGTEQGYYIIVENMSGDSLAGALSLE